MRFEKKLGSDKYRFSRENFSPIRLGGSVFLLLLLLIEGGFSQDGGSITFDAGVQFREQTVQSELWLDLLVHDEGWDSTTEARRVADNILLYQRSSGGWPKNIDMRATVSQARRKELREYIDEPLATIDNGATYTQLYFLAKVIQATGDQRYVLAFYKGFDYLLNAQYDNGGWPQYYPLRKGYYARITFNDNAMIGVLRLLSDVVRRKPEFAFVDEQRRRRAQRAIEKGIDCILKAQIEVDGQLTAWCAQHDERTLQPARARSYELPSLSGKETVGIVRFLMEIENPSAEVINAVQSTVDWLDRVRIEGIRVIKKPDPASPLGFDKVVISDPDAPPIWARFYQIGSNRPFFSDRDGRVYYRLAEISAERRNDYGWLGYWPRELLEKQYPKWQQKWVPEQNVLHQ